MENEEKEFTKNLKRFYNAKNRQQCLNKELKELNEELKEYQDKIVCYVKNNKIENTKFSYRDCNLSYKKENSYSNITQEHVKNTLEKFMGDEDVSLIMKELLVSRKVVLKESFNIMKTK